MTALYALRFGNMFQTQQKVYLTASLFASLHLEQEKQPCNQQQPMRNITNIHQLPTKKVPNQTRKGEK